MIQLNPFKQSTSFCGPASLKILLEHYGKGFSEDELAKMCKSTVKMGTSNSDIVDAIKSLGLTPIVKTDATIDDLRNAINDNAPVLVGWTSDDVVHFSVVYGIDLENVYLMDPELDEGKRILTIEGFLSQWHDEDSKLGVKQNRWMLTIKKTP